jgi:energy-coupling factor transporter transmembrane protein EcfT
VSTVAELRLLRVVPGSSPVRRLWAGTKLLALVAVSVTLTIAPTWPAVAVEGALIVAGLLVGRIPAGARPKPPRLLLIGLAIGAGLALLSGGSPTIDVAGASIGLGGLELWARAVAVGLVVVTAALLLSWTTPVGEVAPALARLGRPLRFLRVPVDEWAVATGLALRSLPLLVEEIQTMLAARRLRAAADGPRRQTTVGDAFNMLATILVVSMRRARDMGDAIEGRGGWSRPEDRTRLHRADALALLVIAATSTAVFLWLR